MTTNQTIDGVPRETVEITRKLAEQLTEGWNGVNARIELRALLDAPACKECEGVGYHVTMGIQRSCWACKPAAQPQGEPVALAVWYGSMPESNGKSNWTAILYRKGGEGSLLGALSDGITIERSEYPDRVRYEADRVRYLIGELKTEPWILDYDADKHSGYVNPQQPAPVAVVITDEQILESMRRPLNDADGGYVVDNSPEKVIEAGRSLISCLDEVKRLNP